MRIIYLLLCLVALFPSFRTMAATNITTAEVNGTWTLAGSPYYIHNDITLPVNQSLLIEPGVEIVFMGNYYFSVNGFISAAGTEQDKIVFRAHDNSQWSNFSIPDGGWRGMNVYISQFNTQTSVPIFKYCVFKDIKSLDYSAFLASYLNMEIDHCEFYNNYAEGGIIGVNYFGNNALTKLKFTNNVVYDNQGTTIMHTLFTDSTIMTNNQFYNNQSIGDIVRSSGLNDTISSVLLFQDNEMYNNHVLENAAVLNVTDAGSSYIENNKFYRNTTTLKGAVLVSTRTALIEGNLIANNSRVQKNGFFCGINDGGAGLHLLGRTVLHDEPGKYLYTVRNNIIANNYSDLNGAAIWAQHCKVTIVNNTIINNLAVNLGAALNVGGQHAKVMAQNNIFYGNEVEEYSGKGNFQINPVMQEVNLSYNLIDEEDTYTSPNVIGLNLNTFDDQIILEQPTIGAGLGYDAYDADFSPTEWSTNIIDQGNSAVQDYGTTDYKGNNRVIGNAIDFGAIEYNKDSSVDIRELNLNRAIDLYPIPAKDFICFIQKEGQQVLSIKIYNIEGRVFDLPFYSNGDVTYIDLNHLNTGQYLIQVQYNEGTTAAKLFTVTK